MQSFMQKKFGANNFKITRFHWSRKSRDSCPTSSGFDRNRCDTYLISSGSLFVDLSVFNAFFKAFTVCSLYFVTRELSGVESA